MSESTPSKMLQLGPARCTAKPVMACGWGEWVICMYGNIQGSPLISYIMVIAFEQNGEPQLLMTLENNEMGSTPFLCAFHDGTHYNLGTFEDWRDPKALLTAAIRHAADYGIQNPYGGPVALIPMPDEALAAGWYPDPLYVDASPFGGLARSRYWDGAVWTSTVRTRAK
jgi:hypothetical protein